MGGSGSPSTTRAGAAGCGVTGSGVDGLGATETGIILPDLWLSAIGKSGVAAPAAGAAGVDFGPFTGAATGGVAAAFAGPEPRGWRPRPPFVEKAGGCGGNPLATRWRIDGASGRSGAGGPLEIGRPAAADTLAGGSDEAAGACPGATGEVSDCAGSPRSRAGGVSFEFTANPPPQRQP